MPCARIVASEAASQPSARRANHTRPHSISRSAPDSASSSRHSVRARRADAVYSASSPCPQRIRRVSPPEVARRSPGSNWSTSVTSRPLRASHHASEAPKVPAPTITTESMPRGTLPCRGMLALAAAAATLLFGHSAQHRPLRATRVGDGPARVLVVGSIHGDETAGGAVIARLRRSTPPAGIELWLVDSVNPDGVRRRTRQNAHGVDLNRNFGRRWAGGGRPFDTYFPGRRAFSEPESQAVRRLVRRIRPAVTVWYHQHMRLVDLSAGADRRLVRAYARRVGLPARRIPNLTGTATRWQNHSFPGTSAFVVELPAGPLPAASVRRHAKAVVAAGRDAVATTAALRPRIVWKRIPFGAARRAQTR